MKRFIGCLVTHTVLLSALSACGGGGGYGGGGHGGGGEGGGGGNPPPVIMSLFPASAVVNTGPITLTITGTFNANDNFTVAFGPNFIPVTLAPTSSDSAAEGNCP